MTALVALSVQSQSERGVRLAAVWRSLVECGILRSQNETRAPKKCPNNAPKSNLQRGAENVSDVSRFLTKRTKRETMAEKLPSRYDA